MSHSATDTTTDVTTPPGATGALPLAELAERTAALAGLLAGALTGADGAPLHSGPADPQEGAHELLPPGGVRGVIASVRDVPGVVQVVLLLGEAPGTPVPAGDGSEPAVPEPWMAPLAAAMERWATALGGQLHQAMPVGDAATLEHLLVATPGTALVASGLFDGTELAGSVALVGHTDHRGTPEAAPHADGSEAPEGVASTGPTAPAAADPGPPRTARQAPSPTLEAMHVLAEVEMKVTAELGRTRMSVSDLLALAPGSLIELDRTAGSPIDLLVNGTLIARGEVVVVDEEYGIRLTEVIGSGD